MSGGGRYSKGSPNLPYTDSCSCTCIPCVLSVSSLATKRNQFGMGLALHCTAVFHSITSHSAYLSSSLMSETVAVYIIVHGETRYALTPSDEGSHSHG